MNNLSGILNQHAFSTTVDHSGTFSGVRHYNSSGRLHLLESGTVKIVLQGGKEMLLDRPSIVLLPTATPHRLEARGESTVSLISASVSFCLNDSSMLLKALPDMLYLQVKPSCSMSCTVQWLFKEVFEHRFGKDIMINKLGEIFMLQMLRHATEQGSLHEGALAAINHPQMRHVIDAIHSNPGHHWTLNCLAGMAAMSRSKFAESFKNLVGQTPNDYITDLRLAQAQKLLKNDKPVSFVAGEVGYEHGSALVRIFKKKLGLSPRQWLQQSKSKAPSVLNA